MGCTHFVVGRDHTGVGDYYAKDETRRFFDQLGDLIIEPIFFNAVGYDKNSEKFMEDTIPDNTIEKISGSAIRKAILESKNLPNWYMREEIQELIKNHKGQKFFK